VWLVTRPGAGAPGHLSQDATELAAARLGPRDVDAVLANEGTLAELWTAISAALAGVAAGASGRGRGAPS
jgi:hypothetical protein